MHCLLACWFVPGCVLVMYSLLQYSCSTSHDKVSACPTSTQLSPIMMFDMVCKLCRLSMLPSVQVLLGHPYDMAIDMWSLGCMAAELFLGLPLFPGASEHDLLVRIVDMLGMPPHHVLQKAQHTNRSEEVSLDNVSA